MRLAAERLVATVLAARTRAGAGGQRWSLVVAAVAFAVVFALGLRGIPDGIEVSVWPFVVLALVVVPAVSAANALEYAVGARIAGHRVSLGDAAEVSVLSSAANLLPLPGAALVRVRAMRRDGSSYSAALSVTLAVGVAWLATSLVLAGIVLVAAGGGDATVAAVASLGAGGAGIVAVAVGVRRLAPGRSARLTALLLGAEVLAVVVAALRYLLVFRGLGLGVSVAQSVALTVAGAIASALGFVPGGLGLREALAGAIAGVVGLPAATGVLGAGVDRLVGLPVLAVLALVVGGRAPWRPGRRR